MDASPAGSDSSTEYDQTKTVVVSPNAAPNHAEKVTSSVKTLNGSTIIISHSSGTTSSLTGMSKICTSSESGSTLVSNELKLPNVTMPPTTNSVIQTCMNTPNNVTSSPTSSAGLGGGLTVTLVKPCMQTAGSEKTLNGDSCTENVEAPQEPLTSAPFRRIQTPLLNSDQSPCSSVTTSAGSHIVKLEAVKTIIKTEPQTVPPVVTNADNSTPGIIIKSQLLQSTPKTCASVTVAGSPGGIKAPAPQVLAPRLPQTAPNQPNLQNIQLPPGMVLVRSDSGQLMMIHQQILAQMQGTVASRLAAPASAPQVQITTVQSPGSSILPRQATPSIIKQEAPPFTSAPTITLQRPQVFQSPAGAALPGTSQQTGSPSSGTTVTLAAETMENVKKCKNFLSTLIKLASSGKQSSETAANVKHLVKDLLDGKIEPEDFTSKLYKELSSSPQPYLVPFLKRSLPALRQLTPDSATFIQQSQQPAHMASTPRPTPMVVLSSPAGNPAASASRSQLHPVLSTQGHPASLQGTIVRSPQVTLATTSMVSLRGQTPSGLVLGQPQVQFKQLQQVPMARAGLMPGLKTTSAAVPLVSGAQKTKLREPGSGTFREEDDINDVASMAGVNLSEESARILATNSALVGAVTRSFKDEAFLYSATLQRRILEIGKKCGVVELGPELVTFLSHATEQRLRNLLERVTEVAQHKNISFKDDSRYEQKSDVRAQLKFFELLDQVERQRKDEQEREILMKAAKSRARQEDPEQLRLKQKAKEMQQQELAQMRQREANLTALAAIGSRKKRKLGSAASLAGAEGSGFGSSVSGSPGLAASRQFSRQRITRVNLRDLLFCLENERESNSSQLIYKGFLK